MVGEQNAKSNEQAQGSSSEPVVQRWPRSAFFLVGIGVLCFTVRACAPIDQSSYGPKHQPAELLLAREWYLQWLSWMPVFGMLLFAAAAGMLIWKKRKKAGIRLLVLGVFGFAGSPVIFSFINLAPWLIFDTWHGPDGNVYSFVDSSFLQGQTMAITRRIDSSFLWHREKVLGCTNGDSPRSWATVIRPAGVEEQGYGQLMYSDSGWLLGMRYDERCYLAYHLPTGLFLGHGDIESISPFLLLDDQTDPNARDVAEMVGRFQPDYPLQVGRPTEHVLQKGLEHPNPKVREISQHLLSIMDNQQ